MITPKFLNPNNSNVKESFVKAVEANNGDVILFDGPGWYCPTYYPEDETTCWSLQGEDIDTKPYEDAVWMEDERCYFAAVAIGERETIASYQGDGWYGPKMVEDEVLWYPIPGPEDTQGLGTPHQFTARQIFCQPVGK